MPYRYGIVPNGPRFTTRGKYPAILTFNVVEAVRTNVAVVPVIAISCVPSGVEVVVVIKSVVESPGEIVGETNEQVPPGNRPAANVAGAVNSGVAVILTV
jgi:hypothetical protein